jgi:hypothetical protein
MRKDNRFWLFLIIVLFVCLAVAARGQASQPRECNGHVLITGELQGWQPGHDEGYFSIGDYFSIAVHRDGIPADTLRQYLNKRVQIVVVPMPPLQLEKIVRE